MKHLILIKFYIICQKVVADYLSMKSDEFSEFNHKLNNDILIIIISGMVSKNDIYVKLDVTIKQIVLD